MKRILLYDWGLPQMDLWETLEKQPDCEMFMLPNVLPSEEKIQQQIVEQQINICISFNFFTILSEVCQELNVLYIAWVYDSPNLPLYSPIVYNDCNVIFTFDYQQMEQFRGKGVHQIYHLPLAVNVQRLEQLFHNVSASAGQNKYSADISFVGSIYDGSIYETITCLPSRLKGYLEGICAAQREIYNESILEDCLRPWVIEELQRYVELSREDYDITYQELFCEIFLKKYVSSQERKNMLTVLGKQFPVVLYSNSSWSCDGLESRGMVSYRDEMPFVFHQSRLNLNIPIRSILSGIPLRCLDVMGAGGALLSKYQPELAEYFVPEEEWICFQGQEELVDKTSFYLSREDLRRDIAKRGFEKVKAEFTFDYAVKKMFQVVEKYL